MRERSANIRHILVIEDGLGRKTLSLEEIKYTLGRKPDNQIVLHSKEASRRHATLVKKNIDRERYSYWILDGDLEGNKSHNGIYVNGTKCLIHELKDGDLINFGCEINASYHTIVPVEELLAPESAGKTTLNATVESEPFRVTTNGVETKSTLILDGGDPLNPEETIHDRGYLDSLTDLPNRYLFHEYLALAIHNAGQNQRNLAILSLDIDRFQDINERFGYGSGDKLLQSLSVRLRECTRSGDITARWGGDEFIILLPQIKEESDLEGIEERLVRTLRSPFEIDNHSIALSISIASVLYPRDGEDSPSLLRELENRLLAVKQENRNADRDRLVRQEGKADRASKLEYFLQKAIEREELSLYYQPRIYLPTGAIEGLEVLLRWQHPQYGTLAPDRFLPLLEETDSIFRIGHWVLQQACQQATAWRAKGITRVPLAINVSPRQLHDPRFPEAIARTLSETGLSADAIEIEMTEASFLENRSETYRVVHELYQIGVGLTLDDFGIGQISIGYLSELPIRQLKIAQALVKNMGKTPRTAELIRAMLAVGQCLNLATIAEGVETREQLETLDSLGFERIQGNFISSPVPVAEIVDFLRLHRDLAGGGDRVGVDFPVWNHE